MQALEFLNLDNTMVTDVGISKLAGLKKLKTLQVSQTAVTDAATDELKAAIPGLAIVRK
jgi:hypothetical protein